MCKECQQYFDDTRLSRVYYKDPLCLVFKGDNGEIVSISSRHETPHPKNQKWITLKGEIYAKKLFGQKIVMAYNLYDHYKVIFKPMPSNKVMQRTKGIIVKERRESDI